ncbi:MAG: two-component regulator propeller domain-containing protein [Bacteroidia bacterium]
MGRRSAFIPYPLTHILALLLGLGIGVLVSAQSYTFERIPSDLGLSQNFISALCQDEQGFIWAGTYDGLNRFDGYKFKTFTHEPDNPRSISNNRILSLFIDSKKRLWIGTNNGLNLFEQETETFRRLQDNILSANQAISVITEDAQGAIWVGSLQGKVFCIKPGNKRDEFEWNSIPLHDSNEPLTPPGIMSLVAGTDGTVWVMQMERVFRLRPAASPQAYTSSLLEWDEVLDPKWKPLPIDAYPISGGIDDKLSAYVFTIQKGRGDNIWLRTLDGIGRWNPATERFDFSPFDFNRSDYSSSPVTGTGILLEEDSQGKLWMGGARALVKYDPAVHQVSFRFDNEDKDKTKLFFNNVRSFLQDKSGNYWIGTRGKGLYTYSPFEQRYKTREELEKVVGQSIRNIFETRDGVLWFSDTDLNLFVWDKKLQKAVKKIANKTRIKDRRDGTFAYILSMDEDKDGNLWLAGEHLGSHTEIYKLVRDRDQVLEQVLFTYPDQYAGIYDLHFDPLGTLWAITNDTFGYVDFQTGRLKGESYNNKHTPNKSGTPVIHPGAAGEFWLGTAHGLIHYDVQQKRFTHFLNDPKNPASLANNMVKTICPDPQKPNNILWLGTGGGGLCRFDITSKTFKTYTIEDGLTDNVVYGILSDDDAQLWISTNRGLNRFDPQTEKFETFTKDDGLLDDEFNSCAYAKCSSGDLVFGGIEGINLFSPSEIKSSIFKPTIAITDFLVANKSINLGSKTARLNQSILTADTVVLSYLDQVFSIEFAALDFSNPNQNQFAFRLTPFNDEWQEIGAQRRTTFTNIDPGKYTFEVKGTNASGIWNEEARQITIIIKPPWWQTWWAYLAFVALSLAVIFAIYRFWLSRKLDRAEALRLAELDTLRSRLYTNITHEFRTPLTVILGMAEQLKEAAEAKEIIQRNGENLLRLINQLLDLSKLESGHLKLEPIYSDVIPYLNYLTESFFSIAQSKEIRLVFFSSQESCKMDFDEEKIKHIVNNLISNALKFTPPGGKIVLHADHKMIEGKPFLELALTDTGTGIPAAKLPYIFDRFFQADGSTTRQGEGTGIGLALTKELVQLMEGTVQVKSVEGKGSTFTVKLPITHKATEQAVSSEQVSHTIGLSPYSVTDEGIVEKNGLPLLLVVEDNKDLQEYIRKVVSNRFQVLIAEHGKRGLELALEEIPDMIISDVMMPEMNGYELVKTLKHDERTSHIPIVLLTAKATEEAKIKGLKSGADAYLMKPFNKEELLVRLDQLLALRERLQQRYASHQNMANNLPPVEEMSADDLFIHKLQLAVEQRINDPTLNRETLAGIVNLSNSQLYRKLKALTELTPNVFIRNIRLQKSLELLRKEDLNIADVAYSVGFNDPNYFTRVFRDEFGMTPGEFKS